MHQSYSKFQEIDIFGATIPTFTLAGHRKVKSWVGAGLSAIVLMLTLAFGLVKL